MKTWLYLSDPAFAALYWPSFATGLAIALMGAVLSVFVVLKRLSFIGQGISHAAFGGIGIAAVLGLAGWGQLGVVTAFCLLCGWWIARLSDRRILSADTAIGIVLVGAMTLGAVLLHIASRGQTRAAAPAWESVLFGSVLAVGPSEAVFAWLVAAGVLGTLAWFRRPLLFWAFDESAAAAFGVPTGRMRILLMVLLTVAIVASMKLAGVILATALLVLPGAAALQLSERLRTVFALALGAAVIGLLGGLVLSFEMDWPPGPSIVAVLVVVFAAARAARVRLAEPAAV